MILAFCLYKYFPYGGLQRDFLRIATVCKNRGHQIRVYTMVWQGDIPDDIEVIIVPVNRLTNHSRNRQYYQWVRQHISSHPVDRIVGFNKMPGLDFYYAADTCYAEKVEQNNKLFYKLTGRYRHYAQFEKAVFGPESKTKLLMLTERQVSAFTQYYQTNKQRFFILPPGIDISRKYNDSSVEIRKKFRHKHNIGYDKKVIIQIGSDFKRKGVKRSLLAIAALPEYIKDNLLYLVIGQDVPSTYLRVVDKLQLKNKVKFYSGRDDIPDFLFSADLLIHPAHTEAAGIVLLEAIISGLPVMTTDICGYADHIRKSGAGLVMDEPYTQQALNDALASSLVDKKTLSDWSARAITYSDNTDLYSLPEKAADIILGGKND